MKSPVLARTTLILPHEEFSREDQRHFQKVYQLHRESLLKILYRFSGDWSLAEDAVHHAFATLYEKRRDYDLSQPLKSLLLTIALNYARLQHRSHARKDSSAGPDSSSPTPRDRQSPVESMIRDLPPEERAILVLRFYDHASYQEIAQILRIPLGTVKWKMHDTIRKLRPRLEALSDEL
ncbi:MAG TPA: RNA polymerase sigma factor [Planctomycetota bacterium]|jgi:RNA polymerase sigma factor (sigma-70 family)|nr:RNA polymerase sigma factor [Planctomycetota bacterium]